MSETEQESVTPAELDEAKYRIEKAARCIRQDAIPNANASLVYAWGALGGDPNELAEVIEGEG